MYLSLKTPLAHLEARNTIRTPKPMDIQIHEIKLDRYGNEIQPKVRSSTNSEYDALISWLRNLTGAPLINRIKQYKHLAVARNANISKTRLKQRAEEMWKDSFYQEKGMDWGSVISSFDRKA